MKKAVSALDRLCRVLCKIMEAALVITMAIMVVIMFSQIVMRATVKQAFPWGEEFLRYLFIINTFLGASVCLYHGDLSRFELLSDKLPPDKRRVLHTFINLFIIGLLCLTGTGASTLITRQMNQLGTSVKIPMGYIYSFIPVSCFSGIVFLAMKELKAWFLPDGREG